MSLICEQEGVQPFVPELDSKLGLAICTLGEEPINGLRHIPENGTNGWYIWCGNSLSEAVDFFQPLYIQHINDHLPLVSPYLVLPPGYRFQIDSNGYEDIWFDDQLIA